jgi:ubiquinone/menaquinone biosynthesis C-methylase UbiE
MALPRVLEPEVMDTLDEATDYDTMDHAEVNRRFVDDLVASGEVQGDVLDLGTGTAQIPVELCRRHADCRVVATDMAVNMLDLARYNIEIAGLMGRIRLEQSDAKRLPYRDGDFSLVMSNSIVHHLPQPAVALKEAVRVVAPGGRLFFRDLMRPESREQLERLVDTYAAGANEHQRKMFADSLAAALTLDEIRALIASLGFDPNTVQPTSDRHWTWCAVKE